MATQNDLVQQEFTRQAAAYALSPVVANEERIARLVREVAPPADARVLEVASGHGLVAMAFALHCREVVGMDITPAMLAVAEETRQRRGLENVRFQQGDATALPFPDREFDVCVCRIAVHHFAEPGRVIAEMARVCRVGGLVVVEDMFTSELPERAAYRNRFEQLRDPSHYRALPLSELIGHLTDAGVEVERITTNTLEQPVERWFALAQTPAPQMAEAHAMIVADEQHDHSGSHPYRVDGALYFTSRAATLVGRVLTMNRK